MSSGLKTIRQSVLLNRLVLDQSTTEEFGRVEVVWMHPEVQRVMGFVCSRRLSKRKFAFKLSQLQTLGTDSIVVNSAPVETDAEQVGVLETLIGHELWSDAGNRLGTVTDCLLHLQTGDITDYLFRSQGWRGYVDGLYKLPTAEILRFGEKRVLVSERSVALITVYADGLEQKVSNATQELKLLSAQTQTAAKQAQGQLHSLTEKASQQVQSISTQAAQKAKAIGHTLREEQPRQKVIQEGQSFLKQLQERAQNVGKDMQQELLPLTQQVTEKVKDAFNLEPKPSAPVPRKDWETIAGDVPAKDLESDEPWI